MCQLQIYLEWMSSQVITYVVLHICHLNPEKLASNCFVAKVDDIVIKNQFGMQYENRTHHVPIPEKCSVFQMASKPRVRTPRGKATTKLEKSE